MGPQAEHQNFLLLHLSLSIRKKDLTASDIVPHNDRRMDDMSRVNLTLTAEQAGVVVSRIVKEGITGPKALALFTEAEATELCNLPHQSSATA